MPQRRANDWFQFKQFRVEQGHTAMKVTTHACLFGALVPVAGAQRILDIGAGTGLLSLMLAQRSYARIDAVELDAGACLDAAGNFAASPWPERLQLHQGPIQSYMPAAEVRYDCIVSNPPFFSASWRAGDQARNLARHDDALPLLDLLMLARPWLCAEGQLWLLLPIEADDRLADAVDRAGWQILQQIDLRASADKPVTRRIIGLGAAPLETAAPAPMPLVNRSPVRAGANIFPSEKLPRHRRELCIHADHPAYSQESLALLTPFYQSL